MGRVKWQWLAVGVLLLIFTALPAFSGQPQDATGSAETQEDASTKSAVDDSASTAADESGAATDDEDAAASEDEPAGEQPAVNAADEPAGSAGSQDSADTLEGPAGKRFSNFPSEPPPPRDLRLGTQPGLHENDAVEIVSGGSSATPPAPPENGAAPGVDEQSVAGDSGVQVPPLWTPHSGRFLLGDRQQELSLRADADTADPGDGRPAAATAATPASTAASAKPAGTDTTKPKRAQTPNKTESKATAPAKSGSAKPAQTGGLLESLDLPEAEAGAGPAPPGRDVGPAIIPSQQFNARELADTKTGSTLDEQAQAEQSEQPEQTQQTKQSNLQEVGVIPTRQLRPEHQPTLGEVLNGDAQDPELGSQVPGINPYRSLAVVLICLALLFVGVAASKRLRGPFKLGKRSLQVLENISLGTGRQLTIVEMGESALVLGITSQSINLLDKVPLGLLNRAYRGTIEAIVSRESEALPDDWAQRPVFEMPDAATAAPHLAPPLTDAGTYGPSGRRVNVAELRRSRAGGHLDERGLLRPLAETMPADRASKADLINRLREQLNRLEE